jgi:hypothetical protein
MRPLRQVQRVLADVGHVLAVQTAPREPAYLPRTLASLEHAGLARWRGPRAIFADGCLPDVDPLRYGWNVFARTSREGQARTFFRLLRTVAAWSGFTALTLLEDDVVLARSALDYIATVDVGDLAFLAWINFDVQVPWGAGRPSIIEAPITRYRSNAALTLPAATVRAVLASPAVVNWQGMHGADSVYWGLSNTRCGVHYPSLAQHVGEVSSVGDTRLDARVDRNFVGEDFDTNTLGAS